VLEQSRTQQSRTLLLIKFGSVDTRQASVAHVLDGELELGARPGFLSPVEDEKMFEAVQQFARGFSSPRRVRRRLTPARGRVRMSKMTNSFSIKFSRV
jgi:hypothetical protein